MKEQTIQEKAEKFAKEFKEGEYYGIIVAAYKNGYVEGARDMIKEIKL